MPEYTILTALAVPAAVLAEVFVFRNGLFKKLSYWLAMIIVLGFQVPVDGWLTKLSDPIVMYNPATLSNIRFPWDIPIEDFGFGFAMVTFALSLWLWLGRRKDRHAAQSAL